jgi:beta-lactamase regulating signal transducer with metallopeptidase domain
MIIVCQKLLKFLKISGIALFPFILIRNFEDKKNKILINHEKIHLRQQIEMLIIFFYIFYVIEYYYWVFKLKNGYHAYQRISFEREAYANEHDLNYLKKRKLWSFRKYL